jgi:ribonuclease T2
LISQAIIHTGSHAIQNSYGKPGEFDYFTLVLSWSPTYCETRNNARSDRQCSGTRPYAFVLHGLWPQNERGWPEFCRVENSWIPNNTIESMLDIMPSKALVIHEWKKHGTCSGYTASGYYATARELFSKVKIPARYFRPRKPIVISPQQIEHDFLSTNNNMTADMISIVCGRRNRLREVRICFDRNLNLRACGGNESQHNLCRLDRVILPPVRG